MTDNDDATRGSFDERPLAILTRLIAMKAEGYQVPEEDFTQSGYPSVHYINSIMDEGFDCSAAERTAAWDDFRAGFPAGPATSGPQEPEEEGADPDEFFAGLYERPGTGENAATPEEVQAILDQPDHRLAGGFALVTTPVGDPLGSDPEALKALYAAMELAAGAAWNAVRTIVSAERNDRYAMAEWTQADREARECLTACLRAPEECALDEVVHAIDPRLLPIGRGILSVLRG